MVTPTFNRELYWTDSDISSSEASSPDLDSDYSLNVAYDEITHRPITVLLELLKHVRTWNYSITNVNYKVRYEGAAKLTNSEGQDDNGLSRDLITTLSMKLFSKEQHPNFLYIENGFPNFRKNYDDSKAFLALGVIMGLCLDDRNSYTTGPLFNHKIYEFIYNYIKCSDLDKWRILTYKELTRFSEIPEDVYNQSILELSDPLQDESSSDPINFDLLILELAKKHSCLQAIESICYGIYEAAENIFNDPSRIADIYNSDILKDQIEGVIDPEEILTALFYDFEDLDSTYDDKPIKEWLTNWIKQAKRTELERLLWAITGNRTLTAQNEDITITLSGSTTEKHLPFARTCYSTLYLPAFYPDEATFKQKLETFLDESLNNVDRFQEK